MAEKNTSRQPTKKVERLFKWNPVAVVEKYDQDGNLYETVRTEGNGLTNAGIARLADLIIGGGAAALDDAHVRLGVGDSNTAFNPTDTGLGGSQFYQTMTATYPSISGSQITWRAEFTDTQANFTWECWGLDVDEGGSPSAGATPDELFNRKVFNFGTKSGGTWSLTVTINIAQPS